MGTEFIAHLNIILMQEFQLTWISRMRLCPLKAKAMIPSAFSTSKILEISVLPLTGLYETFGSLPSATDTTHIAVQYPTAVTDPTRETPAMEFKLGS